MRKVVSLRPSVPCVLGALALIVAAAGAGPVLAHGTMGTRGATPQLRQDIDIPMAQAGVTVRWISNVTAPDGRFLLSQGPSHDNLTTVWVGVARPGIHSYSFRDPRTILAAGVYRLVYQDRSGAHWLLAEVTVQPRGSLDSDATPTWGPDHQIPATLTREVGDSGHHARRVASSHRPETSSDGTAPPGPPP